MNKEMIKTLIADGWEWVACDKDGTAHLFEKSPVGLFCSYVRQEGNNKYYPIPSCLFPNITFENSPVELKTLLGDDEEQDNIQREIKMLIVWKFEYLLKQGNGDVSAYNADGKEWRNANRLKNFVPEVHEKVYLKDLVKKRKVKKSVWLAVDKTGGMSFYREKPIRGELAWKSYKEALCTNIYDLDFLVGLNLTWKDEPLELTYEVEE